MRTSQTAIRRYETAQVWGLLHACALGELKVRTGPLSSLCLRACELHALIHEQIGESIRALRAVQEDLTSHHPCSASHNYRRPPNQAHSAHSPFPRGRLRISGKAHSLKMTIYYAIVSQNVHHVAGNIKLAQQTWIHFSPRITCPVAGLSMKPTRRCIP